MAVQLARQVIAVWQVSQALLVLRAQVSLGLPDQQVFKVLPVPIVSARQVLLARSVLLARLLQLPGQQAQRGQLVALV